MTSPTQRSLAEAKGNGWSAAVVERWVNFGAHEEGEERAGSKRRGIRQDLFGVIDLLVLDDKPGVLGVQACAGSSHAARATKVRETILGLQGKPTHAAALKRWLVNGNRIEVWSWTKHGLRGKRKLWDLRVEQILSFQGIPIPYVENMETK